MKYTREQLESTKREYSLKTLIDAQRLKEYWSMPTGRWPPELFWYVQGYCGSVGGCGEVIISAIAAWLRRKPKNKFDHRIPKY